MRISVTRNRWLTYVRTKKRLLSLILLVTNIIFQVPLQASKAALPAALTKPRVNVPYMPNEAPYPSHAIFWYGKVDEYHNNTDVRIIYYPQGISFTLHIIDRLHWIDTTPTPGEIKDWDSVSVYLNMNDLFPATPQTTSYRFDIQLGGFYTIYKGNGSVWEKMTNVPVNIQTGWRGSQGPNSNVDGKGWQADLYIPFSSLGLAAPPPQNSIWGLAVTTYDRDDAAGKFRFSKTWPTSMQPDNPSTWGEMSFGWKPFKYPSAIPTGKTVLRHGLNSIIVRDGEVGGHTTCGEGLDHWKGWGNTNYASYSQINVQNQWDISDWPCFSKFYITFPLDTLPKGKTIISAKLSMTLFGNAGGGNWGDPPDSFIQVLTVNDIWDEAKLTWNNAPLAQENIAGIWVKPRDYSLYYETYTWEIRPAVETAYNSGQPLRLALYSADGEPHTGKYFWTSDSTEWGGNIRPTLEIVWGDDCSAPGITCYFQYLPLTSR